jgi:hypothetical protein
MTQKLFRHGRGNVGGAGIHKFDDFGHDGNLVKAGPVQKGNLQVQIAPGAVELRQKYCYPGRVAGCGKGIR